MKRTKIVTCISCKHYEYKKQTFFKHKENICTNTGRFDPITGKPLLFNCEYVRNYSDETCNGKWEKA